MSNQSDKINRRITLKARPKGEPKHSDFEIQKLDVPKVEKDGEFLLRTVYLSLDPYMRGRMSEAKSYAKPTELGDVMTAGAVCRVVQSKNPKFKVNDWVLATAGWQDYILLNDTTAKETMAMNLGQNIKNPSYFVGIFGMPSFTAYMGLLDIGQPKPGETVVVAAATGPVGSVVGQIAKLKGCHVVGIAGGKKKCEYAVKEFGFDQCLDHQDENLAKHLAEACPKGIDVYFENVGGKVFDAVLPLLNTSARIPVCGLVSMYNATSLPEGPYDRLPLFAGQILSKRLTVRGFIIFLDYGHRFPEFNQDITKWYSEGKIKYLEDMVEGFDKTIDTFIGMLKGANFGKVVVKFGDEQNH